MLKKIIISIVLIILFAGVSGVFAEGKKRGVKGKPKAAKKLVYKQHQDMEAWFKELKKAHSDGDMEKMGRLIRKMEQHKKGMQPEKGWFGKKGNKNKQKDPGAFKKKFGKGKGRMNKGGDWQGLGKQGKGFGRRGGRGFRQQGMGGQSRGFGQRRMGRQGRGFRQQGMGGQGRGFRRRRMGGQGRGFGRRRMGGQGRGFGRRRMGGQGRGFERRGMGDGFEHYGTESPRHQWQDENEFNWNW